ncbi:hypothetical protein [Sphingosinithalassobacter portus]|uniref:hypothetical protein n=1 Tax=Stakelama portus TaxID=2676234 RepID=UPI00137A9FED|nr:hypothetical protein [Sphingosinithalassobacter portus]
MISATRRVSSSSMRCACACWASGSIEMGCRGASGAVTHRQRIAALYPYWYTVAYRAWIHGVSEEAARQQGVLGLMILTVIPLAWIPASIEPVTGRFGFWIATAAIVIAMLRSGVVHERLLVKDRIGVRYAETFDDLSRIEKNWMLLYATLSIFLLASPTLIWMAATRGF